MEKEQIYYGKLVPVTDGESARSPTIVIIQNNTEDHSRLSEKAEEILAQNDICEEKQKEESNDAAGV